MPEPGARAAGGVRSACLGLAAWMAAAWTGAAVR